MKTDDVKAAALKKNEDVTQSRAGRHKRWGEETYDDYGDDAIDYQDEVCITDKL
jgi:hypothetical protein